MNQDINSDKNMSLPFDEEVEILEDPKRTIVDAFGDGERNLNNKVDEFKASVQNNDIYENNTDIPIIRNKEPKKKMDTVLKVQIILVILWVVLTVAIYFFGYKLFEPIIPISY